MGVGLSGLHCISDPHRKWISSSVAFPYWCDTLATLNDYQVNTLGEGKFVDNLILNNGETATFLYVDDWSRPVYKLKSGTKVCCVNCDGTYLHTISAGSGEPDSPIRDEYQPTNKTSIVEELPSTQDFTFDYMFLDRLRCDLEYYFGFGNRNDKVLHYLDVHNHIAEMKNRLDAFPKDKRPEWLTEDDISNYESRLTA